MNSGPEADLARLLTVTVKLIGFGFIVFYLIFSGVVYRQVQMMNRVLQTGLSRKLRAVAVIHAILAVIVFVAMLITL